MAMPLVARVAAILLAFSPSVRPAHADAPPPGPLAPTPLAPTPLAPVPLPTPSPPAAARSASPSSAQPGPGTTATATVRTGDHPGYGRVVFDLPPGASWTLDRSGDRLTVRFAGADPLPGARPPRNVRTLTVAAGTAELSLAPGVQIRPARLGNRLLVDVLDPVAAASAGPVAATAAPERVTATAAPERVTATAAPEPTLVNPVPAAAGPQPASASVAVAAALPSVATPAALPYVVATAATAPVPAAAATPESPSPVAAAAPPAAVATAAAPDPVAATGGGLVVTGTPPRSAPATTATTPGAGAAAAAAGAGTPPAAPSPVAADAAPRSTVIEVGTGRVFHIRGTIASLFAADPKVVEVRPASHNTIFVFGLGPGHSTVAALDDAGNTLAQYNVVVRPSWYGASELAAAVQRAVPGANVQFSATPDGLVVGGQVPTPAAAAQVAATARSYAGDKGTVDNRTTIPSSVQVTLRVRIAEISRTITRQLGINWTALANFGNWRATAAIIDGLGSGANPPNTIGAGFNDGTSSINTVLDLLAQDQLITMLAEPNLTARSGETASFLAGGEFPIPIAGSGNGSGGSTITVAFKQYGISLAFVPTVLSDGRISLHVHPEVSELTTTGAVSVPIGYSLLGGTATVTIPALTVRRADTTVELGSGQSFAIAGLLDSNNNMNSRAVPYAGEIPVVGALFKSDLYTRDQDELVIVVTPYIVNPVSSPSRLRLPTDGFVPAADVDRVLFNRQRAMGTGPGAVVAPTAAALGPAARLGPNDVPVGAGFILH